MIFIVDTHTADRMSNKYICVHQTIQIQIFKTQGSVHTEGLAWLQHEVKSVAWW